MRFLFTFVGGRGHFDPMVPVARAAVKRDHVVAVAGAGSLVAAVERAGFTAIATSDPQPQPHTTGNREPLPPVDPARDDWEIRELFARRAAGERAEKLLEIGRDWRPDVVIRDEVDFGAAVAAEKLGIPCVTVLVLAAGTLLRKDLVAEPLHELRAGHGLPRDPDLAMLDGQLVLSPFPEMFRGAPLPPGAFSFRQGEPIPQRAPHERPGVYFTLGTDFNTASGDLFERALAGLGRLDADVTTTVGSQLDPAGFGPQPANVSIHSFVPQAELLPKTDLVVSHGGSGSVLGALAHGLPSLVFAMGADQPGNARRLARLGAGLALDPETATPGEIHDTAVQLLTEARWRAAAQRVQEEINAQPGAEETVPLLEITATSAPGSPRRAP
ncbi:glycosyltransferase [Amycolatopsis sp. NPDC004368]